jgi:hypothetical protein
MCKTVLVCDDADPLRPVLKWANLCSKHAHFNVHNKTWTIPHSLLRFIIEGKVFERTLSNGTTVIVRRVGTNKLNGSSEAVSLGTARSYAVM